MILDDSNITKKATFLNVAFFVILLKMFLQNNHFPSPKMSVIIEFDKIDSG